ETVHALKTMIKKKKESITCDADALKLYLALKNGAWLSDEDADLKDLSHIGREGVVRNTGKELIQEDLNWIQLIRLVPCFVGEQAEFKPEIATRQIHVLVVVPEGARSILGSAMELSTVDPHLKQDLCNGLLKGWDEDQVSERYYYSGGNVRQFLLDIVEEIRIRTLDYLRYMDDPFSFTSVSGVDIRRGEMRRTFVKDPNDQLNFIAFDAWELNPDYLYRIFNWARAAGHALLAGSAFELCLHLFAADNRLKLYVSEYEHPEPSKSDCDCHLNVKQLRLQHGRPACTGLATDYETDLTKWRDNDNFVYWFPHCYDFPNIDSIVKLKLDSGKKQVAYLQITTGKEHSLDVQQLKTMNDIFK
ncbi:hypothetical protein AeMF1_007832, partial [Aphanomyces euteiches]